MTNRKGPSGANAEAFSSLSENAQYGVTISHPVKFLSPTIQGCDHSAKHSRAVVRHVERLDGPARNLCFACWRQVVATEVRDALIARWDSLWKASPWVIWPRGAIQALAVILAPIGEGGRGL